MHHDRVRLQRDGRRVASGSARRQLEASVEHIASNIADIKDELKTLRSNARADFRWVFGALVSGALGFAAIMATGFRWS